MTDRTFGPMLFAGAMTPPIGTEMKTTPEMKIKNAIDNIKLLNKFQRRALHAQYGHMVIVEFNIRILIYRVDHICATFEVNGEHVQYSGFIGTQGGLKHIKKIGVVPK